MDQDITKHLRLRITFKRHPGMGDRLSWERWKVEVYECIQGVIRMPYLVTGELDYIEVPDQWWSKGDLPQEGLEPLIEYSAWGLPLAFSPTKSQFRPVGNVLFSDMLEPPFRF